MIGLGRESMLDTRVLRKKRRVCSTVNLGIRNPGHLPL